MESADSVAPVSPAKNLPNASLNNSSTQNQEQSNLNSTQIPAHTNNQKSELPCIETELGCISDKRSLKQKTRKERKTETKNNLTTNKPKKTNCIPKDEPKNSTTSNLPPCQEENVEIILTF